MVAAAALRELIDLSRLSIFPFALAARHARAIWDSQRWWAREARAEDDGRRGPVQHLRPVRYVSSPPCLPRGRRCVHTQRAQHTRARAGVSPNGIPALPLSRSCIEARGLHPKDGSADGGTSDPYVKVTCMNQTARTEAIQKELNPIWDRWLVLESVRSPSDFPLHFGQLLVSLYDEDFLTGDDEIGSFEIDLAEVWKREGNCVRP